MHIGGLGVSVADLPNGGRNLRIFTYDPPGSAYNVDGKASIYNTGHYDLYLPGGACSMPDAQSFNSAPEMNAYIQAHAEWGSVIVTRADLPGLCAAKPPTVQAQTAPVVQPQSLPTPYTPYTNPIGSGATTITLRTSNPSTGPSPGSMLIPGSGPSSSIDTGNPASITLPAPDNTILYVGLAIAALLLSRR